MPHAEGITLRGIEKVFPGKTDVQALDDINLHVMDGEFLTLVGPSGCGKSTLLRLIAGLIPPTMGEISVHGKTPKQAQEDVEFGFVFQDPVLFPWLRVLDNVKLPDRILRDRNPLHRQNPEQYARQLLADVGLAGFEHHYPEQLSGGMKQRVALARALVYQPSTLLMDEPFGALDEFTRDKLNMQLLEVWEKFSATVIFVTHSIQEAVFLADRIVVLGPRPGHVVQIAEVPFGRPRDFGIRYAPEFTDLVAELRGQLQADSPEQAAI
jgi:NitT/TauT family transport system ATP-binding protein